MQRTDLIGPLGLVSAHSVRVLMPNAAAASFGLKDSRATDSDRAFIGETSGWIPPRNAMTSTQRHGYDSQNRQRCRYKKPAKRWFMRLISAKNYSGIPCPDSAPTTPRQPVSVRYRLSSILLSLLTTRFPVPSRNVCFSSFAAFLFAVNSLSWPLRFCIHHSVFMIV